MTPRWLTPEGVRAKRSKDTKRVERRVAEQLGGRRLPASGSRPITPDGRTAGADITAGPLIVEHKRVAPSTASIGIKREYLRVISETSRRTGKVPALGLLFEGEEDFEADWVLLPLSFVRRLLKGE